MNQDKTQETDGAEKTEKTDPSLAINSAALDPLFPPWQEPDKHRMRSEKGGAPTIKTGRRVSPIQLVNPIRAEVREWRDFNYFNASETTRTLLHHWFGRAHRRADDSGGGVDFRYYFCQREAIETFIYLNEIRRIHSLSAMIAEFGGLSRETEALGINPKDDEWARYGFKLATGAGKTKCMSLAIVWSYFHALYESGSALAKHFVIVAPNLTVFERLREDFRPEGGGADIFTSDPLIPPEWAGDWNFSVVLQDEASGGTSAGVLYLTNIHRLFAPERRRVSAAKETYDWAGPAVSKTKALDTGAELRDRITAHPRLMVLNDEAHHVWDPDSAWNQAIRSLHETTRKRSRHGGAGDGDTRNDEAENGGGSAGLVAQLDFTATPKDNKGRVFPYVVCDTPLGEAVDAGIIKTPVIGRTKQLVQQMNDDAAYQFEAHLRLGYERWKRSREEWGKSGHKPLLFVMCTDTKAADQIANRLNSDAVFADLNGKTINLHTNLKGKVKKKKMGGQTIEVFEESEKDISAEDLKAIRRISRDLDSNQSPYSCIVSVLMLREGWDVRNVTTIVPLRPYSAKANILPEQTLGRGLRRMTPPMAPPGQVNELVTVVEHPAFSSLYEQELEREGLSIEVVDTDQVPATTVTIFPDETKDWEALDIKLPTLTAAHEIKPVVEGLTLEEVRAAFADLTKGPLPLGAKGQSEVNYEGRHMITNEVVEEMKVHLPLLRDGLSAISFYIRELETACKVQSTHQVLAPLLQKFLGEILFEEKVKLFDSRLTSRLGDHDVREHIRAVFIPLINSRTVKTKNRRVQNQDKDQEQGQVKGQKQGQAQNPGVLLRHWKPYQATYSERKPVAEARNTLFNLVPCDSSLEVAMTSFLDQAPDVAAFAKNAGPQSLRIDFLTKQQRLAFYRPDFFVRLKSGDHALLETKGRQDMEVPRKAMAALEWCKTASKGGIKWQYVFTPQNVMEGLTGNRFEDLLRACVPALKNLLNETTPAPELPLYADRSKNDAAEFFTLVLFDKLPVRGKKAATDALALFRFLENNREETNFAPVFSALLGAFDEACKAVVVKLLRDSVPADHRAQQDWFEPHYGAMDGKTRNNYATIAKNLKRGLVYGNPHSVIGLLRSCLDIAANDQNDVGGVFSAIREKFDFPGAGKLLVRITAVNTFRNTYVAHAKEDLTSKDTAVENLKFWVETLTLLRV